MDDRPTIVPEVSAGSGGSAAQRSGFGIPQDLLEKARRRLGIFGLVLAVNSVVATVAAGPLWAALGFTEVSVIRAVQITFIVLSAAIFLLSRAHGVKHATFLKIGLVYEVALCFLGSLGQTWMFYRVSGQVSITTTAHVFIVAYPLIVPGPPGLTLIAAVAATLSVPASFVALEVMGEMAVSPIAYIAPFMFAAFSGALAIVGSRVVYGISRDVAKAREMGSYKLESLLGRGGMGEVWRAKHRLLVRPAAIKLLRPGMLDGDPERQQLILKRFEREAQATASLRSPNTIELFDFGTTDNGVFYYVMELLDGFDAEALVSRFGALPVERAVHLLYQICASLAEAHEAGLVHRDIKPSNIYVCRYGREFDFVKVLDFGLVKPRQHLGPMASDLTSEGSVSGTPSYMSPEQAMGTAKIDARTDIYALGCVAYWLLTGKQVFEGPNVMAVMASHIQAAPVPPSQRVHREIPPSLDTVILACLEKDPSDRPQSADELTDRISQCDVEGSWTFDRARAWWDAHGP